jgi:putative membrane protein insertion efficiency factor
MSKKSLVSVETGHNSKVVGLCIAVIHSYQHTVSPRLGDRCRYEPTCSQYAILSLQKYGLIKGLRHAATRLASCGSWSTRPYIDYP